MSAEHRNTATRRTPEYDVETLASRPDLLDEHQRTGGAAWPEFMLHDLVAIANWETLMAAFPQFQLSLLHRGAITAVVNAVPLRFEGAWETLPDRGVDWGVEQSVRDHQAGREPNALMGMQVVVTPEHQGKGLSAAGAREMLRSAAAHALDQVLLPVRPAQKHLYPLIPMEDYLGWTDAEGRPFDGWMRVHHKLGGQVVGICSESMIIPGTIAEWSAWTGQSFPGSGRYVVPGALNPIEIDLERDQGVYREPNVWVVHRVPEA